MREFRKTTGRSLRPNVWRIGIDPGDPATVVVRWGLLDGAIQETKDCPGPCGTEGHSDYQTAEQYALFCMNREIRKKTEQGYVEWVNGEPVSEVATAVGFDSGLPKNLSFYKPKTEISDKALQKLHDKRRAVWTLKRDGMMHVAVKRGGIWEIYSRRMDVATERFPHVIDSLRRLSIPDNTILLGEMVFLRKDGSDDFKNVSRICRSDPDLALAYQGLGDFPPDAKGGKVLGKVSYYVFDIAFWNSQDLVRTSPVRERLGLLKVLFQDLAPLRFNTGLKGTEKQLKTESRLREGLLRKHHLGPVKIYTTSPGEDLELAKKLKAEGFVVVDADAVYSNKGYSFDGKAQRPEGIYKRKPKFEDEFIITGVYEGTGRNRGKLGGFFLQQICPETGGRLDCGKCGGGFTDEQRAEFWEDREHLVDKTIKVEFDSRQPPKNGVYALRFPVYKGASDKTPEECVAQI